MHFCHEKVDEKVGCPIKIDAEFDWLLMHLWLPAKQTYDDAVDSGHTAMLLEEDDASGDIFRCLIGNLPPGAEATIKFAYVIELRLSPEGAVVFVLPTQLNPRYNPSEAGFSVCYWRFLICIVTVQVIHKVQDLLGLLLIA